MIDIGLGLEESHVMVTGSSGAIGSVIVKAFLAAGAYVSAFDLVEPKELIFHDHLHSQIVDITNESQVDEAFETARERFGVVATLVAAAGLDLSYLPRHSLADMSLNEWKKVMNVNVDGTFLTCRAWLRGIRAYAKAGNTRNVAAVILGSEAGRFGVSSCAPYATSKAAIQVGLVKSLAADVASINPSWRVNAIAPGAVDTLMFRKECADDPAALWREAQATVAMKKPVAIEAVARACLFLASDAFAGNITGQLLPVDSGKSGTLYWLEKNP